MHLEVVYFKYLNYLIDPNLVLVTRKEYTNITPKSIEINALKQISKQLTCDLIYIFSEDSLDQCFSDFMVRIKVPGELNKSRPNSDCVYRI